MTIAFVQKVVDQANTASSASQVVTVLATTTAGNRLILAAGTGSAVSSTAVVDSRGNTWARDIDADVTGSSRVVIFSANLNVALQAGDTITVTVSIAASIVVSAWEFSGAAKSAAVDKAHNLYNAATNAVSSGATGTLTNSDDLVFSALRANASTPTITAPAGYTNLAPVNTLITGAAKMGAAYKVLSADSTAQTAAWTLTNTPNTGCGIVTYKIFVSLVKTLSGVADASAKTTWGLTEGSIKTTEGLP